MSVNTKIEEALFNCCKNIWPVVCPDAHPPEEYIVYNPELESPELYGDDEDLEWTHYMQIHFFTKKNYISKRKEIRKLLRTAGFTMTDINTEYEKDTKYFHLIFSCYIEESEE
ncbi:MAG: hypothetical protein V8Q73_02525 [Blautia sp.]|jgi:hypothetical protein